MKRINKLVLISLLCIPFACTDDFEEINTNPTAVGEAVFNANYLLPRAQWDQANTGYHSLLFQSMWIQGLSSTFNYYSNGDKYFASSSLISYQDASFNREYGAASRVVEMQRLIEGDDAQSNLYHIGTIIKVLALSRASDLYGDVPYSEALQAKNGISQPAYDRQEDAYPAMLADLQAAITALDNGKASPTSDLYYDGNIDQWRKFGYSLMLRLAMRLTEAAPTVAQQYAEAAAAGGTFTGIADNAFILGDQGSGYTTGVSSSLRVADDYREVKWSKTFIDFLSATNDPRLGVVAEVPPAGLSAATNQDLAGDTNPAIQKGMPNGYDLGGGATDITNHPDYGAPTGTGGDAYVLGEYSRPVTALYLNLSGPIFTITYAETELLLAEAKARNWNVGATTAAEHYANGVTAAMQSLAQFNDNGAMDAGTISTYVTNNPLDVSTLNSQLQMINEQYWATTISLFNFIESWSNWRRTGFPALTPVTYTGQFTPGTIPVRIPYHSGEQANNPANFSAAVGRLSNGDTFTSSVWWDQ